MENNFKNKVLHIVDSEMLKRTLIMLEKNGQKCKKTGVFISTDRKINYLQFGFISKMWFLSGKSDNDIQISTRELKALLEEYNVVSKVKVKKVKQMENKEKKSPGMKPFSDRGEIKQRVVLGVKGKYLSKFSSETVMKNEIYSFLEKHKGDLKNDCNK